MNKDVEEFQNTLWGIEEKVTEYYGEKKWDTPRSITFGDKGTKENDICIGKKLFLDGSVTMKKISNGWEVKMPRWLARKEGLV
jgi:hypothetical protein